LSVCAAPPGGAAQTDKQKLDAILSKTPVPLPPALPTKPSILPTPAKP